MFDSLKGLKVMGVRTNTVDKHVYFGCKDLDSWLRGETGSNMGRLDDTIGIIYWIDC